MQETPFPEVVRTICKKDPRYDSEAYFFVRSALDSTAKSLGKPTTGPSRHVSGHELLDGIRTYALNEFGPMAFTVLTAWGVKRSEDFGEIVFNLVEAGVLGRTEEDKREDFANGYDFSEAFTKPFLPASRPAGRKPGKRETGNKKRQPSVRKKD
jgi:uncharacterized repeat protein (TIGR04138 family)